LDPKKAEQIIDKIIEDFKSDKKNEKHQLIKGEKLTKGGFGVLYEIKFDGKDYVGKLIKKIKKEKKRK